MFVLYKLINDYDGGEVTLIASSIYKERLEEKLVPIKQAYNNYIQEIANWMANKEVVVRKLFADNPTWFNLENTRSNFIAYNSKKHQDNPELAKDDDYLLNYAIQTIAVALECNSFYEIAFTNVVVNIRFDPRPVYHDCEPSDYYIEEVEEI
jgi:hypothetical protein